jgi:hypothetical protein
MGMTKELVLATSDGVVRCRREPGGWREGVVLAGTTDGVMRSEDGGRTWDEASAGLTVRHVRWLAYHPAISDREFAGTEPTASLATLHWQRILLGVDRVNAVAQEPA